MFIVGKIALGLLILIAGIAFLWLVIVRIIAKLAGGQPCPFALVGLLDNPLRRRYVQTVLDSTGIQPGERVLELGPGVGTFTVEAAHRAAPGGSVVAVDIQPEMIAATEERVRQSGLTNVETHVASAYALPVETDSIDRAFLVTVLPEIPDRQRALAELRRALKPGGILSITEEFVDPDYLLARTAKRSVEQAGFNLLERQGNWWRYTLNFRRAV